MPGLVEAIDHDTIVSGQLPKNTRALIAKRLKGRCADDRLNRAFKDVGHGGGWPGALEFDNE